MSRDAAESDGQRGEAADLLEQQWHLWKNLSLSFLLLAKLMSNDIWGQCPASSTVDKIGTRLSGSGSKKSIFWRIASIAHWPAGNDFITDKMPLINGRGDQWTTSGSRAKEEIQLRNLDWCWQPTQAWAVAKVNELKLSGCEKFTLNNFQHNENHSGLKTKGSVSCLGAVFSKEF